MNFVDFAAGYGLHISDLIADNRWHRCPTESKPKKKNGAYVFDGSRGAVIDFATMTKAATFRDGTRTGFVDRVALRARAAIDKAAELARHDEARAKAQKIIDASAFGPHPYLEAKGFPKEMMLVHDGKLVIPMRDFRTARLNSVQLISADGEKKFMPGGKAKGSVFPFGPLGRERWLCEGYATALSIYAALEYLYRDGRVIVCFSAGNLSYVGQALRGTLPQPYVFADNDESGAGARAAEETGLPWCMAPETGMDANDVHMKQGVHALAKIIRAVRQKGAVAA